MTVRGALYWTTNGNQIRLNWTNADYSSESKRTTIGCESLRRKLESVAVGRETKERRVR